MNSTSYKPIALLSGPMFHHLDHLAPLCYFLNCPLLVDDLTTYSLGKKYYPGVNFQYSVIDLKAIGDVYNLLIVSTRYATEDLINAYHALGIKSMRFCYCSHGQSDKPFPLAENKEALILLYGEREKHLLQSKNSHIIGNFRLAYYQAFQPFFDSLVIKSLDLPVTNKTILYAPTWNDPDSATSFFASWETLLAKLPSHYNLVLKLHPLLERHHPSEVYRALSFNKVQKNISVLLEFPLIYPLLNQIDIYLGDYSSIGYDFLYFNRPLFFLGGKKVPLHECGVRIVSIEEFWEKIEKDFPCFQAKREAFYRSAFSFFDARYILPS